MSVEERLVAIWAEEIAQRVTGETIARLQRMRDLMSGDDSGLENTWEELCVQVQGEESIFWSSYERVLDACIEQVIEERSRHEQVALWLVNEESFEWREEHGAEDLGVDSIPIYLEAMTADIRSQVLQVAADFENERIYRALWRSDEDEEPYDEAEDDDSTSDNVPAEPRA